MQPYSIYLHIPFCKHRCGYCDFNTYAGIEDLIPAYTRALCLESSVLTQMAGEHLPVHTIFFGGGTPSLLPVEHIDRILQVLHSNFDIQEDIEVTLEANPGTVTLVSLNDMRASGVTRLSLGVQSSITEELQLLEREHDFFDVIHAISWARQAGFENINLDLIYGLPGQSVQSWLATLGRVLTFNPNHLSLYALSVEHGTPLQHWVDRGMIDEPDADLAAEMYEIGSQVLADAGYIQYEISNWARRSLDGEVMVCRHNIQYWQNLPYLGIGAGAHGYANRFRVANIASPSAYIARLASYQPDKDLAFPQSPATIEVQPIDQRTEMAETMMMGMRLVIDGVSVNTFRKRFNVSLKQVYSKEIDKLLRLGLVEWTGKEADILRITKEGRLLGNLVFREFV